jgi:hypothetical protein
VLRSPSNAREVSRHVAALPPDYEVQRSGEHWVVAGPTGIYTVGRAESDPARDAERTSMLAHELRAALSDEVPWVPFVDALLVAPHDVLTDPSAGSLACTVVELDMLRLALTTGAVTVHERELAEIQRLLPLVVDRMRRDRPGSLPLT